MVNSGYTNLPKGAHMTKNHELNAAIDTLLKTYKSPEEILGENGLLKQLTKAVLQRALQAEMTHHLGHEKHGSVSTKIGRASCRERV